MKINTKQMNNKKGFTLVEVLVSLGVISLLVPGILMTIYFFNQQVVVGVEKNINITQYRYFEQFFTKQINGTQISELAVNNGGYLLYFTKYDEAFPDDPWRGVSLQYNVKTKEMIYHTADGVKKVLLTDAVPLDGGVPFTLKRGGVVRCALLVGNKKRNQVELNVVVSTRNL